MIACPCCRGEMRPVVESGVEIDICDLCHAIWLDPGELNQLTVSADDEVADVGVSDRTSVELSCPHCGDDDFFDLTIVTKRLAEPLNVARCNGCSGFLVNSTNLDRLRYGVASDQQASRVAARATAGTPHEGVASPGLASEVASQVIGESVSSLLFEILSSIG